MFRYHVVRFAIVREPLPFVHEDLIYITTAIVLQECYRYCIGFAFGYHNLVSVVAQTEFVRAGVVATARGRLSEIYPDRVNNQVRIYVGNMDLNNVLWVVVGLLFICMNGKAYSGSTKSDVADAAAIGASASEVLNNVDEIKHRNKKKKPKRDTQNTEIRSTRVERDEPIYKPSLTSNGVLGYAEDFVLIQHSPDSLRKEIKNDDVIFGDIVACMMSNGYTQHYAVVVNGNGTTVGFGWDASGQKSTDIMGIPYKRVPGYFEYVTANQLSHAYNNKCVLLRNAYTQYYLDIDSENACIDKLKSKYGEWALTLENRMNSLLKKIEISCSRM